MFVCLSQLILKVGIGTTTLVGGILFAKGEIDALTFFMYLLVVSRMYDPFQVALENLSAIISTDTQCKRMDEILSHEEQDGNKTLSNQGYDINFDHVGFSYDGNEQILKRRKLHRKTRRSNRTDRTIRKWKNNRIKISCKILGYQQRNDHGRRHGYL